jgi:hypothetical protein
VHTMRVSIDCVQGHKCEGVQGFKVLLVRLGGVQGSLPQVRMNTCVLARACK